jgi:hypothetical protein
MKNETQRDYLTSEKERICNKKCYSSKILMGKNLCGAVYLATEQIICQEEHYISLYKTKSANR